MNWFDKMLEAERLKKAQHVEKHAKTVTVREWLGLDIKIAIRKSLKGEIKIR